MNQPELTDRRFVTVDGQRWYRTGDIVCCDADGEYVFVGRVDRQLKLHGHRIEPEEIEAVICTANGVGRCAVVARPLVPSVDRHVLVAFVAAADSISRPAFDVESLRSHLKQSLPHWMMPQRIEIVEQLPVTPSGKVDIAQLATIPLTDNSAPQGEITDLERRLLAIWRDVLSVLCGPEDDFLKIGGDSLAVLEIIALAKARSLDISPALFASGTTVRAICASLASDRSADTSFEKPADELRRDIQADAAELRELAAAQTE